MFPYGKEMLAVFQEIITEFHQAPLPKLIVRDTPLPEIPHALRKALIVIGMRRSGKTWLLYQYMQHLLAQGRAKTQLVYINFEDDRLYGMEAKHFPEMLNAYWSLYPEHIGQQQVVFFFDEIAEVPGWERFIRRLLDKETMQIVITGSSAKMLSKEIATNLRGRTITREVFPFSFAEMARVHQWPNTWPLDPKQQAMALNAIQHYVTWGGFPEALSVTPVLHRELLQGYMDSVIYRDIIERHDVRNHHAVKQLLLHCLHNPATLLSVNKVFQQFKARGLSVSKDALYQFVDYLADAYCIFTVSVYSFSLNKAALKPKKVYLIDTGLVSAYAIKPGYEKAGCLENAVFLHLRRQCEDIFYFQTRQGHEVDFLLVPPHGVMQLYQVSMSLQDEATRQREVRALQEAMQELSLSVATIITWHESDIIRVDQGEIRVMPLYQAYVTI